MDDINWSRMARNRELFVYKKVQRSSRELQGQRCLVASTIVDTGHWSPNSFWPKSSWTPAEFKTIEKECSYIWPSVRGRWWSRPCRSVLPEPCPPRRASRWCQHPGVEDDGNHQVDGGSQDDDYVDFVLLPAVKQHQQVLSWYFPTPGSHQSSLNNISVGVARQGNDWPWVQ